jgi:lipocalin
LFADFCQLWILSRNRTMSESRFQALLSRAQKITGYDAPAKVSRTNQTSCPAPQ